MATGTPVDVVMPQMGVSGSEGTVTKWLKAVGDAVAADEPLLEISTDKVDTEIPSPVAGVLLSIEVAEDETVPVGAVLAHIGGADAPAAAPAAPAPPTSGSPFRPAPSLVSPPATQAPAAPAPTPPPPSATAAPAPAADVPEPAPQPTQPAAPAESVEPEDEPVDATYVTPLVRKRAAEHSVALSTVTGTGVGGRVRKQDVLEAAARAR